VTFKPNSYRQIYHVQEWVDQKIISLKNEKEKLSHWNPRYHSVCDRLDALKEVEDTIIEAVKLFEQEQLENWRNTERQRHARRKKDSNNGGGHG
tara:strand:+ start:321 stop:602 length:282 start_codon:yes stop_codon:yes gene_type:complete